MNISQPKLVNKWRRLYWLLQPQYYVFDSKFERQSPLSMNPIMLTDHLEALDPNPFQNTPHHDTTGQSL